MDGNGSLAYVGMIYGLVAQLPSRFPPPEPSQTSCLLGGRDDDGDGARRRGPQTLGIIHGVFRHHNESEPKAG